MKKDKPKPWLNSDVAKPLKHAQAHVLKVASDCKPSVAFVAPLQRLDDCQMLLAAGDKPIRKAPKIQEAGSTPEVSDKFCKYRIAAGFHDGIVQSIISRELYIRVWSFALKQGLERLAELAELSGINSCARQAYRLDFKHASHSQDLNEVAC